MLANAPTPLGEPVVECKLLIIHSLPSYQLDRLKTILVFYSCFSSHHFSACDRVASPSLGTTTPPVTPQRPQRVHGPPQQRHEPLQRPQRSHFAKETINNHFFSTNVHQSSPSFPHAGGRHNRTPHALINVLHHLVHAAEASPSTTSCCCLQTLLHHQEEGHELETPTTTSNNISSTSRDPSSFTSTSTPSTRLCSLPSAQPHPTAKW